METEQEPTGTEGQKVKILHHLQQGYSITPGEALRKFNCMRLGARIWELRQDGHTIKRCLVKVVDARVAQYELEREQK